MANKKTQQVGVLSVDDKGRERIVLGNVKNSDPKYNYTVQIRILEGSPQTSEEIKNAKVIVTKTNPKISLWDPQGNKPSWLKKNLTVDLVDFVPTKQD